MKHVILLVAMAITCVLAAVANVIITRMIGLNIFTFKLWFVIPAGAVGVGLLGASGAILAARHFNVRPTIIDAIMMVVVAAATMALIYFLDYATSVLADGRRVADLVDFSTYVDLMLTKAHMRVGRGSGTDTGEVGEMGYFLAMIEFIGFLVGGAATFFVIKDLWRCSNCDSYLRKFKTKVTKELTVEEASNVIELFSRCDLETMRKVMAWVPPERTLDPKERKLLVLFNLYGCPTCKTEVIGASVNAFDGSEWKNVPSLTTRRNLSSGSSLRDQFA